MISQNPTWSPKTIKQVKTFLDDLGHSSINFVIKRKKSSKTGNITFNIEPKYDLHDSARPKGMTLFAKRNNNIERLNFILNVWDKNKIA